MKQLHSNAIDIRGQRFGRLIAKEYIGGHKWRCVCDCGCISYVRASSLRRGSTKSCGCLRHELEKTAAITHGQSKTKTYKAWTVMRERCCNPRMAFYKNYGGRGITICDRWNSFMLFLEDMKEAPEGGTLERKDNNGNYCPENCRWATRKEQAHNRRVTKLVTFRGETKVLSVWAQQLQIKPGTLHSRLLRWPIEKAFTAPVRKYTESRSEL